MPNPTEHKTVQARILEYAEAIGWTFVSQKTVFVSRLRRAKVFCRRDLNRRDRKEVLDWSIWPHAAAMSACRQFWHRLFQNLATACRQILEPAVQESISTPELP